MSLWRKSRAVAHAAAVTQPQEEKISATMDYYVPGIDEAIRENEIPSAPRRPAGAISDALDEAEATIDGFMGQFNALFEKIDGIPDMRDTGTSPHPPVQGVKVRNQVQSYSPVKEDQLNMSGFVVRLVRAIETNKVKSVENLCREARRLKAKLDSGATHKLFQNKVEGGAGPLHIALLLNHTEIVEVLLDNYPELACMNYETEDLSMQSPFHIAAANSDGVRQLEIILTKVKEQDYGFVLDQVAKGSYFQEQPQEALCLSAAMWAGNTEVVDMLLEHGASLDVQDTFRLRTPLHHLVVLSAEYPEKIAMIESIFQSIWERCDAWVKKKYGVMGEMVPEKMESLKVKGMLNLLNATDKYGHTPLTLAVSLHSSFAEFLLNFEPVYRRPQRKFGSSATLIYDVTDVVSYDLHAQTYNARSVLHVLEQRAKAIRGSKNCHDLIKTQPIKDLVRMKWSVYKWIIFPWCFVHLLYMIALTWYTSFFIVPTRFQKTIPNHQFLNQTYSDWLLSSHALPILFIILPVVYFVMGIANVILEFVCALKRPGSRLLDKDNNEMLRYVLWEFSASAVFWVVYHLLGHKDQHIPLAVALITGWLFMIFFTRIMKPFAKFTAMVQLMVMGDYLYFMSVYIFVLLGFSAAIHTLHSDTELETLSLWDTIYMSLNIVTLSESDLGGRAYRTPLAGILIALYAVVSITLLLNLLIAMMNTSYAMVDCSNVDLYRYQKLSMFLMVERMLFPWKWLCRKSQKDVWPAPKRNNKEREPGKNSTFVDDRWFLQVPCHKVLNAEINQGRFTSKKAKLRTVK